MHFFLLLIEGFDLIRVTFADSTSSSSSSDAFWSNLSDAATFLLNTYAFQYVYSWITSGLSFIGVPITHIPSAEQIGLTLSAATLTLACYYFSVGKSHSRRRRDLERQLSQAQRTVRDLEGKLFSLEALDLDGCDSGQQKSREIRIWMDGAFDMMHFGHMNAFRQGRALGTKLIVGVNSDETITVCKGAPVMNDHERVEAVRGCKWVDEVVPGVPYIMNDEYLDWVIEKYRIDYVVHGDDPCIVDGKDVYESAQRKGKYLTIPRTEGISTTDLVGRMLLMTKSHHSGSFGSHSDLTSVEGIHQPLRLSGGIPLPFEERRSSFLTTSRTIRLFGAGVKAPGIHAKVVYLAGAWDMFHSGHIAVLDAARKEGDYVIVGVHSDAVVNKHRGMNLPIMNLQERVLSVLGCKWVDDVLIDAPYVISRDMISSLRIHRVVRGTVTEDPMSSAADKINEYSDPEINSHSSALASAPASADGRTETSASGRVDPYFVPKEMGILVTVPSAMDLTVLDLVDRIQTQRSRFNQKYAKKRAAEDEYYSNKYKSQTEQALSTHSQPNAASPLSASERDGHDGEEAGGNLTAES